MTTTSEKTLPPLVKTVQVSLTVEDAFRRFTEEMGAWWPLTTYSVGKEEAAEVVFECREGGRVIETLKNGRTTIWGTVLSFDPPHRVRFTWHPGRRPETQQEVEVEFTAAAGGTRVTLTHSNWEVYGDKASEVRSSYVRGWDCVLGEFTTFPDGE